MQEHGMRLSELKAILDEKGHYTTTRGLRYKCDRGEIKAIRTEGGQWRIPAEEAARVIDELGSRPARERTDKPRVEYDPQRDYRRTVPRRYNISLEVYDRMMEEQGGKCCLCFNDFPVSRAPHLDHNHETKEVRGILCAKCNVRIEQYEEDPDLLIRYYEYIMRYRSQGVSKLTEFSLPGTV